MIKKEKKRKEKKKAKTRQENGGYLNYTACIKNHLFFKTHIRREGKGEVWKLHY